MSTGVAITLPRGLFDPDGGQHRDAVLGPVNGHLEARLAEADDLSPAAVSELLAATLTCIGAYAPVEAVHVAALSRGDRDYALLHVRRSLFGDRLALIVTCPNPACADEADLLLELGQLAPAPERAAPETLAIETPAGPAIVRVPTGADDEAVHGLDRDDASALLWSRLVIDLGGARGVTAAQWRELPAPTRHALALAVADADAAAGPTLAFVAPCPSCRAWMEVELDPATLLASELGVAADRLFAEVHTLAYFYHWSEDAILALPRHRRWRYLELVHRQVGGRRS